MAELKFTKSVEVRKAYGPELADQLAQASGLTRTEGGRRTALFSLSGDGQTGVLLLDESVDEEAARAVVEAHVPREASPPAPTAGALIAAIAALDLESAATVEDLKGQIAVVRGVAQEVAAGGAGPAAPEAVTEA